MLLKDLLADMPCVFEIKGDPMTEIGELVIDSRKVAQSALFFCIPGSRYDAHEFTRQAEQNGSIAFVVSKWVDRKLTQVRVENVRSALAYIAAAFYGHPERSMRLIGMCGTKGKTTTSFLMKSILEKAGYHTGLIGTTGNMIGEEKIHSSLTTPDPIDLYNCLREMLNAGVTAVSMEVSAHAIHMHRLDGLTFEAACYMNLSQDHLDYFGTMENYFSVKKSFFMHGAVRNAALNVDDENTESILQDIQIPNLTFGIGGTADVFARDIEITEEGASFTIMLHGLESMVIHMKMTGMFNVYNALAAASLAMILGIDAKVIKEGLESVRSVPGRIEMLDTHTNFKVILDYSHSPDALENILNTVRTFTKNRVIVLFGCGGDRDQGKRPLMGEVGGKLADFSILTSDNPRTEDPNAILRSIEMGITKTQGKYTIIENRRDAIRYAMQIGQEGDVIVLAGKGHETYQDIMGVKRPFDEKVVVLEILEELRGK